MAQPFKGLSIKKNLSRIISNTNKHVLNGDSKFAKINGSCNKLARWNYGIRRWWVAYAWKNDVVFHTRTSATYNVASAKN